MILVTGATGNVGSALLPRLAERGAPVRALTRSDAARARVEALGVEAVDGDLDDPGSLERAMKGCDHLFLLSPVGPDQMMREMGVVDAAVAAGVGHVVAVSVTGADPGSQVSFARWHSAVDDYLSQSGLDWTILRPAGFMSLHLWPVYTVRREGRWYGMTGDGAHAFVDVDDVAEVAAVALTEAGHQGRIYEVTGPEARSMPEYAAVLSEFAGRPVDYVDLPPEDFVARMTGAGVPVWMAESLGTLYWVIREGHAATVSNAVEEVTGRPPRSYRDFAAAHRDVFSGPFVP
ncbi:MAG TPA: SDR family oxidoreductase [Acidimicrobiales bacterium]|nr:SDR family oxidoreductase [Acidimicrobiales bacterium]